LHQQLDRRIEWEYTEGKGGSEFMQSAQAFQQGGGRKDEIQEGTRVRLKEEAFAENRPHLLQHARLNEVGVVAAPSRQSPAMSRLYVIVHFDRCGHDHRLLPDEIEVV
jgi:hypothetical protein